MLRRPLPSIQLYALLAAFVMIYLTDTVGLNAGIVGTLIAVSKPSIQLFFTP